MGSICALIRTAKFVDGLIVTDTVSYQFTREIQIAGSTVLVWLLYEIAEAIVQKLETMPGRRCVLKMRIVTESPQGTPVM